MVAGSSPAGPTNWYLKFMVIYPTISKYLARKFSGYLFLISLVIIVVLAVAGAFGILQKFKSIYITPEDFWLLVLLKIPYLFNEISGIIGFISTILFLRYLSNHNELIVIVSSGMPLWRIFAMPILLSFGFGAIIVAVINPIASYSLKEYERIEAALEKDKSQNSFFVANTGIFFYEKYQNTNRIIQARSINAAKKSISEIVILVVDSKNQLIQRIDSHHAELDNNQLDLHDPIISTPDENLKLAGLYLPTNLSIDKLLQRFTPPEMVSIWYLPDLIDKLTNSGLPIISYQLYFYKQLFKPLTMAAMVFLACWFLNLDPRNSAAKTLTLALIIGIFTYFSLEIALRILTYGGLSPLFATLLPILFIILISNFVILHFQES